MNTSYNIEVLRHDLATLAAELEGGRGIRVAAISHALLDDSCDDMPLEEAAYEARYTIASLVGPQIADEDEDEYAYGIPAIEAFVCLRRVYGADWARLAFADYLVSRQDEVPCREPEAVAAAVMDRAIRDYEAAMVSYCSAA